MLKEINDKDRLSKIKNMLDEFLDKDDCGDCTNCNHKRICDYIYRLNTIIHLRYLKGIDKVEEKSMKFNLNYYIKVNLGKGGLDFLATNYNKKQLTGTFEEYLKYVVDYNKKDNTIKMQMWSFMYYFGDEFFMGNNIPFDMNVELTEK